MDDIDAADTPLEDVLYFFQQGEKTPFEEYLKSLRIRLAFYRSITNGRRALDRMINALSDSEQVKLPTVDHSFISTLEELHETAARLLGTQDPSTADTLLEEVEGALNIVAQVHKSVSKAIKDFEDAHQTRVNQQARDKRAAEQKRKSAEQKLLKQEQNRSKKPKKADKSDLRVKDLPKDKVISLAWVLAAQFIDGDLPEVPTEDPTVYRCCCN